MEMKIVCDCGQKYAFDVEPVDGRMPATVNCPACGGDGTPAANDILSQIFPDQPPVIPVAVAVERAAVEAAPPPPIAPAAPAGGLRINRAAPAPMAATAGESPLPAAPMPITAMRSPAMMSAAAKPKLEKDFNLWLGILGAFLGAALGVGIMIGFRIWADFRFPWMGTGIGVLTGLGARILAKGTDAALGAIAGAIAFMATAGTLYLIVGDIAALFFVSMAVSVYFAYKIAG
jgi:hypothetical protein